jgi:hypothetical protein
MNKKLLLTLSLTLAAAAFMRNSSIAAPQDEISAKYLACYALEPTAKTECVLALQFEAEKQGFKEFINGAGLPCTAVSEGPQFVRSKQAYLVQCEPDNQYWMQFNYQNNQWELVKE